MNHILQKIKFLGLLLTQIPNANAQQTSSCLDNAKCCPEYYYYQNTDVLPKYTFAQTIILSKDTIPYAPKGPVIIPIGSFKTFVSTNYIEIQPGHEIDNSLFSVTGFCDEVFAKNNYDTVNVIKIPNVFTPNGDGMNDLFVINVNSATRFCAEIFQRQGSHNKRIFEAYGDVDANYVNIWNGVFGVDFSSFYDSTNFYYRVFFYNCRYSDNEIGFYKDGEVTVLRN